MLKNKYLAIALVIIAILVVANTVIKMGKTKKSAPPPVLAPPVSETPSANINSQQNTNIQLKSTNYRLTKNQETEENKKTSFSPYLPLKENIKELIDPRSLNWGDDPFGVNEKTILKKQSEETLKQVSLTAIIIRKDTKYAIINNIVFKEGDYKRGILLKKININSVIIASNREEIKLKIFEKKTIKLSEEKKGSK